MKENKQAPGDGQLIAWVLDGEKDRFADIVQRYQAALLRVALSRTGRRDWAEEIVQEAFLAAYKSLHTYDSRYSFRTWLWTILLNQCRRHFEKRQRRPLVRNWSDGPVEAGEKVPAELQPESRDPAPESHAMSSERQLLVERLLIRLPEKQADSLRLRFFGGLKFHEIAAAMNCSLATAKNRVKAGLKRLSELITANDGNLDLLPSWTTESPCRTHSKDTSIRGGNS